MIESIWRNKDIIPDGELTNDNIYYMNMSVNP
jgi:hypothetical protein